MCIYKWWFFASVFLRDLLAFAQCMFRLCIFNERTPRLVARFDEFREFGASLRSLLHLLAQLSAVNSSIGKWPGFASLVFFVLKFGLRSPFLACAHYVCAAINNQHFYTKAHRLSSLLRASPLVFCSVPCPLLQLCYSRPSLRSQVNFYLRACCDLLRLLHFSLSTVHASPTYLLSSFFFLSFLLVWTSYMASSLISCQVTTRQYGLHTRHSLHCSPHCQRRHFVISLVHLFGESAF